MSIFRKTELFHKPNVGWLAVTVPRFPLSVVSQDKVMYRPEFDGAKWYLLDLDAVDFTALFDCEDAFSAMAYLRSTQEMS